MKKTYIKPAAERVAFDHEDVVTSSVGSYYVIDRPKICDRPLSAGAPDKQP